MIENDWKGLYKAAGVAAVVFLLYSLVTMVLLLIVGGPPTTAEEGFALLKANRLVGLLRLDLLTILLVPPIYYVLYLGLYAALRPAGHAQALVGAVLGLAGMTLVLATPSAFSFLALSDKYALATSEAQKAQLLGAGEAILASDLWHGSGALMGGLLAQAGAVVLSILMLRSGAFGRVTAWSGIVTHSLDLAHFAVGLVLPAGGLVLMMVAGPLYLVWIPLVARDFFRLARRQVDT